MYGRHARRLFSPIPTRFHRFSPTRTMSHLVATRARLLCNQCQSNARCRPRPRCCLHRRCLHCRTALARRQSSVFRALRLWPGGPCSHWQSRCVISSMNRHIPIKFRYRRLISYAVDFDLTGTRPKIHKPLHPNRARSRPSLPRAGQPLPLPSRLAGFCRHLLSPPMSMKPLVTRSLYGPNRTEACLHGSRARCGARLCMAIKARPTLW
jgi:hypothetical protein